MVDEPSSAGPKALSIGLLLFPNLTQLDLTGPHEVFVRAPRHDGSFDLEVARSGYRGERHGDNADDDLRDLPGA